MCLAVGVEDAPADDVTSRSMLAEGSDDLAAEVSGLRCHRLCARNARESEQADDKHQHR
jgi:hypothetical protein